MPFYIFRQHILPTSVIDVDKIIHEIYLEYFRTSGVFMTSLEMRRIIHKQWLREDVWCEYNIAIQVPTKRDQLDAINSESMDQYWLDWKPKDEDFIVHGKLTFKKAICLICREDKGHKIKLRNCSCIFRIL